MKIKRTNVCVPLAYKNDYFVYLIKVIKECKGGDMKRNILIIVISISLLFTGVESYAYVSNNKNEIPTEGFTDVMTEDWFYESMHVLVREGIIAGYNDGTFKPMNIIRVDEFIKTMVVALGYNPGNGEKYWASEYITKAIDLNIISSVDFADYTKSLSRAEMAMIAENTLIALEGKKSYLQEADVKKAMTDYNTSVKNSMYEKNIIHVYELGIITGYPDGSFGPTNSLTRAEAVTVIRRVIDFSVRKAFINSDIARLARYPHDTSGNYIAPQDWEEGGPDQQYFVDLTADYIDARYNIDYTKINYATFTDRLKWFYSPSSRWAEGRTAEEEVDVIYWGNKNNQNINEVHVVADKSLVYENRLGKIAVPVTIYFVVRHTSYENFSGTIDVWEKFDAEFHWANNGVKLEMIDVWEYNTFKHNGWYLLSDENMEVN